MEQVLQSYLAGVSAMSRRMRTAGFALPFVILAACGNGSVDQMADREDADVATTPPSVTFTPENDDAATGKPSGPITISYRIIGKPIVGETVSTEAALGNDRPPIPKRRVAQSWRLNDDTARRKTAAAHSTSRRRVAAFCRWESVCRESLPARDLPYRQPGPVWPARPMR